MLKYSKSINVNMVIHLYFYLNMVISCYIELKKPHGKRICNYSVNY